MKKIMRGVAALAFGAALALTAAPTAHANTGPAACFTDTENDVGVKAVFTACPGYFDPTTISAVVTDTKADGRCAIGEVDWFNSSNHILRVDVVPKACPSGTIKTRTFTAPSGAHYADYFGYTIPA